MILPTRPDFRLDPGAVPGRRRPGGASATRPTRPRWLHPAEDVAALARPGRVLVVDEAFADTRPPASPSRSPTGRTCPAWWWCAASPRPGGWPGCGSATCSPRRRWSRGSPAVQPLWPVSTPALAAAVACAVAGARWPRSARIAADLAADRDHLVDGAARACRAYGSPARPAQLVRAGPACRRRPRSGRRCGSAASRCAAATRSRGWARTGCGSPCATRRPPTRFVAGPATRGA